MQEQGSEQKTLIGPAAASPPPSARNGGRPPASAANPARGGPGKSTLTKQVAALLLIPTCGALLALGVFYWHINEVSADTALVNIAGRQRMHSLELHDYAHMIVKMGQEGDRPGLQQRIERVERSLTVLHAGGKLDNQVLPPAPSEIRGELATLRRLWVKHHAALSLIAAASAGDPLAHQAYHQVENDTPALVAVADQVVTALQLRDQRLRHRLLVILLIIAAFDLVLLGAGIWTTNRYVSERRREEARLRQSEDRLTEAQRIAHLGNWDWHFASGALFWSDEVYRIFGLEPGAIEPGYESFFGRIHPDDRGHVQQVVNDALESGKPYDVDHRVVLPDGQVRMLHAQAELGLDKDGRPMRMTGTIQDVTVQKRIEQALHESEKQYRDLVETSPNGIQENDLCGVITFSNPAHCAMLGCDEGDLVGKAIWDFAVDDAERDRIRDSLAYLIREQPPRTPFFAKSRTRDGRIIDVQVDWNYKRDDAGRLIGFISVITDITLRKRTDDALRRLAQGVVGATSEQLFQSLVQNLAQTLAVDHALVAEVDNRHDRAQTVAVWSLGAIVDNFEYDLAGTPCANVMREGPCRIPTKAAELSPEDKLLAQMGADSYMGVPLRDAAGRVMGLLAVLDGKPLADLDFITSIFQLFALRASTGLERKRAEEALRRETTYKEMLHTVAIAANEAASVEDVMQTALDQICAFTGWPLGHVYLVSKEANDVLRSAGLWHQDDPERFASFRRITKSTSLQSGIGLPGRVLATREPVWIVDVTQDSNFPRAAAREIGIKAGFAFPILVGKEVVAIFEFFSGLAKEPDEPLLKAMVLVGTQLGRVIERKRASERLQHLAHFDTLTALPNRLLFVDRLTQALARARWHKRLVAVLLLDLDRFKHINDTLGHDTGDRLLRDVAARLSACVREGDTVARLGGDEFVILLADIAQKQDIPKVATKVLKALASPFAWEGRELFTTASIGISLHPLDGDDAQTLLKNADIAMYRAKEHGKNRYECYLPAMQTDAPRRLALESDLRRALEREEFLLHYQPKFDLRRGEVSGMETLVRWQHPQQGLVPPMEFIPLLEETGLIVPVGEWILRTACKQTRALHDNGSSRLRVAVNLSARQFKEPNLVDMVARVLRDTGLEPAQLELELTESVLLAHTEESITSLRKLNDLGIHLSLDDFGTGYSSLSYLKRFPIDSLKIDRAFVRDIMDNPDDAALTRAIIAMGHSLQMYVVAEGVETDQQLALLRQYGCDAVQGYYFSRPLPIEVFADFLQRIPSMRAE